jgi:hypothetical protein
MKNKVKYLPKTLGSDIDALERLVETLLGTVETLVSRDCRVFD